MAEISMELLKKLRDTSGVGMMDCKKALEEAAGDIEKAAELLRKKGIAVAAKRSSNATENGLIQGLVSLDFKRASMIEVGCETDFSARTADMRNFATGIAQTLVDLGKVFNSPELVMDLELKGAGMSIQSALDGLISKIAEKIIVSRVEVASTSDSEIANVYLHPDGTLGVLVQLSADKEIPSQAREKVAVIAKDVAMHVAVTNPLGITQSELNPSVIAKEQEILRAQMVATGKPAEMIEKIVEGKLKKFYEDNCLVEQKFIKDEKMSVQQYMDAASKDLGLKLKVSKVARFGINR